MARSLMAFLSVSICLTGLAGLAGCGDGWDTLLAELFSPAMRQPLFERGLILPPDSLACIPEDTGIPQTDCNHHGSTVAELPDGTVAAVWYHGVAEKSPDSRIVWSTLAPGETEWAWPEVVYDSPHRAEGNPALWVSEDGTLHVFFVTIFGNGWHQSKVMLVRSEDNGATWSDPTVLRDRYCWMIRHRPVRLDNGELLLPLYNECLAYPVWMRSSDEFATWREEPKLRLLYYLGHVGQIQPATIVLPDGTLTAITRDGLPSNRIKRMASRNNGLTWGPSRLTELPNSGTSVDQVCLANGHVVVVFNNSPEQRFPLSAALSYDGGETFAAIADLNDECEQGSCSYAYPSVMQSSVDGSLWVTYTADRDTIGWVHFNEAWLAQGREVAADSGAHLSY